MMITLCLATGTITLTIYQNQLMPEYWNVATAQFMQLGTLILGVSGYASAHVIIVYTMIISDVIMQMLTAYVFETIFATFCVTAAIGKDINYGGNSGFESH